MLYADGEWLTVADLRDEDPILVREIADANGISLVKAISDAIDTVGIKLMADMLEMENYPSDGVTFAHYRGLGLTGSNTRVQLQQVVVDSTSGQRISPIKTLALHEALRLAYRRCFLENETEKYHNRVKFEDEEIRNKLYPRVYNAGIPTVRRPLARPGATLDWWDTGSWGDASVAAVSGSGPGGTYDIAVTWVDQTQTGYASWQNTGNAESAPSDILTFSADADTDLVVDVSCFAPPTGIVPPEYLGTVIPRLATGWNLYCGPSGGRLRLQNASPFPVPTPASGLTSPAFITIAPQKFTPIAGYTNLGTGQRRDLMVAPIDRFSRV